MLGLQAATRRGQYGFLDRIIMSSHQVTINGMTFEARRGELLLDAALSNGVDLPYDCRSGHCGTCCVRLVYGEVHGGEGAEPGIVHACQCRIVDDIVIERGQAPSARTVEGVLTSLLPLSADVVEVNIRTDRALLHHPGQYAKVEFEGFPARPFSMTHALRGRPGRQTVSFHVRRMKGGRVTPTLGRGVRPGHRVSISGPYGSAYFRPNMGHRLIMVATSTGFAPVWSVAVAALRENPNRPMMIIAGGRSLEALYMRPALGQLSQFGNVQVRPVCSQPEIAAQGVMIGRPTDYLPRLSPDDVIYTCGAPEMVNAVKLIAAHSGAVCYADPFMTSNDRPDTAARSVFSRPIGRRSPSPAADHGTDSTRARPVPRQDLRSADLRF